MTPGQASQPIAEWHDVDERIFQEQIVSGYRPAVFRGLVGAWPAVHAALRSHADFGRYLAALDNGRPVDAILMPPQVRGRIFYNDAMDGFNFVRRKLPVSAIVEQFALFPV